MGQCIIEAHQETPFSHVGVVFCDDTGGLYRGENQVYIAEYNVSVGGIAVSLLFDRIKRCVPGRVAVRRVNTPPQSPHKLLSLLRCKPFVSGKTSVNMRNSALFCLRAVIRFAGGVQAASLNNQNQEPDNCLDTALHLLAVAGIRPDDGGNVTSIFNLLHDVDIGIPRVGPPEMIVDIVQRSSKET